MEEASGRAFAATWRDEAGEVVGTTFGGTMCLWPLKPWRFRFAGDGFEGVIPCGECPGCSEFYRRRLADRLHQKYGRGDARTATRKTKTGGSSAGFAGGDARTLFLVRIHAPIQMHARMAHALHRRRRLALEPGMWRMGASSFAVLAREDLEIRALLTKLGYKFRIERVRLSRGRRAFRALTAGLLVAREIYGKQRNRWYALGLPPADRRKWEVRKIGTYQSYARATSPRAWTARKLVLVPPDVWRLSRTDRRSLRGQLLRQSDPEGVRRVMGLIADVIGKARDRFNASAVPKGLLKRDDVVRWYDEHARRSKARTTLTGSQSSSSPPSFEGGLLSSEHSQGELMPLELERQRRKDWLDAKKARAVKESMEIIERMKQLARKRGDSHE